MAGSSEGIEAQCGCYPFPASTENPGCAGCSPNMYLTCDEEAVLGKLRGIKERVRSIERRLGKLQEYRGGFSAADAEGYQEEMKQLSTELDELRRHWDNWEKRLDEATERKLVLLGHREPSV
jgi:hypothetical protein